MASLLRQNAAAPGELHKRPGAGRHRKERMMADWRESELARILALQNPTERDADRAEALVQDLEASRNQARAGGGYAAPQPQRACAYYDQPFRLEPERELEPIGFQVISRKGYEALLREAAMRRDVARSQQELAAARQRAALERMEADRLAALPAGEKMVSNHWGGA